MEPIDILVQAITTADESDQHHTATALGRHIAEHLTDPTILTAAVQALKDDGWEQTHEGPHGVGDLSDEDLTNIARTVLGIFGGGR